MRRPINRRNTGILLLVILLILGAFAFQSGPPSDGEQSPEAVAQRNRPSAEILHVQPGPADLVGCIRFCWFAEDHPSAVVLHADPNDSETLNWDLTGESGGEWFSLSGGSNGGVPATEGEVGLLNFFSIPVPRSSITYRYGVRKDELMVLGRAASPEAARVDLTYDTGQTFTTTLQNDAFATFAEASAVCSIRLVSHTGEVLQEIDTASDLILTQPDVADSCGG